MADVCGERDHAIKCLSSLFFQHQLMSGSGCPRLRLRSCNLEGCSRWTAPEDIVKGQGDNIN